MIDKIQSNIPAGYTNNVNHNEGRPGISPEKNRQLDNASAEVSLSGHALALQRIMQAVKDTPEVREDVVREIRNQLEAGTYQVNAERLAEHILPLLK